MHVSAVLLSAILGITIAVARPIAEEGVTHPVPHKGDPSPECWKLDENGHEKIWRRNSSASCERPENPNKKKGPGCVPGTEEYRQCIGEDGDRSDLDNAEESSPNEGGKANAGSTKF